MSKSGTLTYQLMHELRDIGFSTCIGIGGDPVIGTTHIEALRAFQDDPDTRAIVMIGGSAAPPARQPRSYANSSIRGSGTREGKHE